MIKHQASNKSKKNNFQTFFSFGYRSLFGIWKLVFGVLFLLTSCNKSPIERASDSSSRALGNSSGVNFVIFSDELKSGGGAFLYPDGQGQTLSFTDTSNSISRRSIRYFWTGQDQNSEFGLEHTYAGFDLMHTTTQGAYSGTVGRDFRNFGYTRATFYARGTLSTNTVVKIEVSNPATPSPCIVLSTSGLDDDSNPNIGQAANCTNLGTLSTSWQRYSIAIPNAAQSAIKDYFKATFVFKVPFVGSTEPGQGGTVYFDQIQYEP